MRLGCCVSVRQPTALWRLDALGVSAISLRLGIKDNHARQFSYLDAVRGTGRDVLGVIDNTTFDDARDWHHSLDRTLRYIERLVEAGRVTHLAVGREWDDGYVGTAASDDPLRHPRGGTGSWVLSTADLSELLTRVSERLGPLRPVPLLLGGIVAGQADVLKTIDLAQVDGILIHPYGSGIGLDSDQKLGAHLDAIQAEIAAQGLAGDVGLILGELGRSDHDIPKGLIADWFSSTLAYLDRRGDVDSTFIYCDSDLMADGYGQFDALDRPKPSVSAIVAALAAQPVTSRGDPLVGTRVDPWRGLEFLPGAELETGAWFDQDFTATGIAQAVSGSVTPMLVEAIVVLWPEFGPWLDQCGRSADVRAKVALLATIWVQTSELFIALEEPANYDRTERLYGIGALTGLMLGNRYHGDGFRYRGRGLVPVRGRATYAHYAALLDLPLVPSPDLLMDPAVAAGVLVLLFAERELFAAAERGDWFAVWSGIDPGRNDYDAFATAVSQLLVHLEETEEEDEDEVWKERYEAAIEQAEAVADQLYAQQRKLALLADPPDLPHDNETKKVWLESLKQARRWQRHVQALGQECGDQLGAIADLLVAIGTGEVEVHSGSSEEEEQHVEEQQQVEAEGGGGEEDDGEAATADAPGSDDAPGGRRPSADGATTEADGSPARDGSGGSGGTAAPPSDDVLGGDRGA